MIYLRLVLFCVMVPILLTMFFVGMVVRRSGDAVIDFADWLGQALRIGGHHVEAS